MRKSQNCCNIRARKLTSIQFCGSALPAQLASDASSCNMPCSGNSAQVCGGSVRLSVYSRTGSQQNSGPTGWYSLGCYTDQVRARTLQSLSATCYQTTPAQCAAACTGYRYFGVEFGCKLSSLDISTMGVLILHSRMLLWQSNPEWGYICQ